MTAKRSLIILGAAIVLLIAILIMAIYGLHLLISASGIIKITSKAIDCGDHIVIDIHVANVDTSRCLSNFHISFTSYERGAYKAILSNLTPALVYTNKYYVFGPNDTWDDQVIVFEPSLALRRGKSFYAQFHLLKLTHNPITNIHGSVGYRGKRFVEGVTPKDYTYEGFKCIVEEKGQP